MSELRIIHPFFGAKDSATRPWLSLALSGLTYLNVNSTSAQVYNWFSNLVDVSAFCNQFLIYVSHIRFRQGLKAQGIDNSNLPFRDRWAPYSQYPGIVLITLFLVAQLYFAIFPFTGKPSAENFFATYITVWFKTKLAAPREMDLTAAEYFDRIDEAEEEQERLSPAPKMSILDQIWDCGLQLSSS
ncbi:hypothetical protein ASPSYDRAFT_91993 [Aspergillus sydowii CBS 593.65]|uniref:Amino acid permease/ SLC12A domain-containing protein n=1 Tax=Aspergillus sydowii CBS 593.65 TaxID=1036612 RepID=A0A1L9TBE3_9EURO|nr:uncharacterized protein ASPSYDRAFT_91993 [Aspergillus sydowii CBS 593.65]OJJ56748.1 hypothetical protein ASPSYDRAFT_91993 [Aspergillus sydowii CBS 593.65]